MTWLLRSIVDLFNGLAAWYYRRKFGAAARQLGRGPSEEDDRRGFIIIEIDGLAHDHLRNALKQGTMPSLARLIRSRALRLACWRCGLPSTTPASQAGIMYGNNWDIPGFRWYDKAAGESVVCRLPGPVRAIQDRISAGRAGLLRGGSSYTNMFDGDARLALFTVSAMGRERLFENVRGLGFLILFGLSPGRVFKVIGLSLWTWLAYVAKRTVAMIVPSTPLFTFWGPVQQIASDIIFREVTTFSVMLDVYRGMPAVYASYTGYDEIAHHFGAESREALRALRGIDRQVRQIARIRELYVRRPYDLYVLSDHGLTQSEPFSRAHGQTLQELMAEETGDEVRSGRQGQDGEGLSESRIHFMLDELRGLEARPHSPWLARRLQRSRQRLEDRLAIEVMASEWDLSRRGDTVVRSSGSLSHVYFNVTPSQMSLSEITLLCPDLLGRLVEHEGIEVVIGREDQEVIVAGKGGTVRLGPQGARSEGENPLLTYDKPEWAAGQIARLARFPHSGDLILLGAWDGERVISFEEQVATHGGLGGPQERPFIAYSARERLSARGIENSEELYSRLVSAYREYS
ncbi:alkaline phosphatase family protein [Chloroflexota bacterium]